jgi:hypothetical protein
LHAAVDGLNDNDVNSGVTGLPAQALAAATTVPHPVLGRDGYRKARDGIFNRSSEPGPNTVQPLRQPVGFGAVVFAQQMVHRALQN